MECKIIFKTYIARKLLKMGNPIIDIKPDKQHEGKTMFIFEITKKFNDDLVSILNEK